METLPLVLFAIVSQIQQVLVSSVETRQQRFVLKGQDVRLDLEQVNVTREDDLIWTFHRGSEVDIVVKYMPESYREPVREKYRSKAEFSRSNFSLLLKNLEEEDSGRYEAKTTGDKEQTVASYLVSVLERVDRPVLKVLSSSPTGDSCNVTCSAQGLSITSSCNSSTCSQVGGVRGGGGASSTLSVYISKGSIICNHSNPVSWEQNIQEVNICLIYSQEPTGSLEGLVYASIIRLVGTVVTVLFCTLWFLYKQKSNANKKVPSSVYENVRMSDCRVTEST